ncbi:hypothetical protein RHSIM_Rhsim07G0173600 [Rhododendron simsii]|uniref:Uncharacterized protein n=1 Tax=Rhododendron simsii TaxID=118357 RepID=A0A834GPF3_RHOSS|nr:hypothetical protein RHSIM_Rhsim07G0173600 [Rhododendron simsii]
MAFTTKQMSLIVATFGALSFIFGVVAENKKPAAGTAITGKGVVVCKYPSDPTVALGYLSVAFLIASTVAGYLSLFYPYKGKSVPQAALFRSTSFLVFFNIALLNNWDEFSSTPSNGKAPRSIVLLGELKYQELMVAKSRVKKFSSTVQYFPWGTAGLAAALLLWPTITEQLHIIRNVHYNLATECPTAKTGLLGGGAFISLDASLFWLVSLMLADNAREDYFDEVDGKGEVGHAYATDYDAADGALKNSA